MLTDISAFLVGGPLHAMTKYQQFLLYRRGEFDFKKQKFKKFPVGANGANIPWRSKPELLLTFEQATAALLTLDPETHSLGFVLSPNDPFFCVDLDHCKDEAGNWKPEAVAIVNRFPGAAVEVSMGGDGLHIFGSYREEIPHSCVNDAIGGELYSKYRAMAISGRVSDMSANISNDCTEPLREFVSEHFKRAQIDKTKSKKAATSDDLDRVAEMVEFIDPELHYEDWIAVCQSIHSVGVDCGEETRAFEIADKLSQRSSKYMAGYLDYKWSSFGADRGRTFGTIDFYAKAGGFKTEGQAKASEVFGQYMASIAPPPPPLPVAPPPPLPIVAGTSIAPPPPPLPAAPVGPEIVNLTVVEMGGGIKYPHDYMMDFAGMTYSALDHAIWGNDGRQYDEKRFNAMFAGASYALDTEARKLVDNAWTAFLHCRPFKFRRVDGSCFRPALPSGVVINHEGRTMVNTFTPIPVRSAPGDISLFHLHMSKILPDERDRKILLSYMAAVVQYPGVKFRWAPLLQGWEGNGKTFFTACVERAVGEAYCHRPDAKDLENKFNLWLYRKLFIAIEDIYIPNHRANIAESLKPMITGERGPIQGKGADQVTLDLCANFMFNSNHRNALGPAVKGRRYAVFFTPQQTAEDLITWGMDEAYFDRLFNWAKSGGFAHITHYLQNYEIEDQFNPATLCSVAPKTSSYGEVISEALGQVEQEIMQAVLEEREGFVTPWISSKAVDNLLRESKLDGRVPRNRRRELIESLGYVRHPHLHDGRTNNAVLPDGVKVTLYVKKGHPVLELKEHGKITAHYTGRQTSPGATDAESNTPVVK